ncbi:MAG: hypothetical protein JXX28_02705 [Deltaproteobacteria bacterium]|nr:hypothetical protein [Deltaproteobacteria bacterium]
MRDLMENKRFRLIFERMDQVPAPVARHAVPDARSHCLAVGQRAAALAAANRLDPALSTLLVNVGLAHDVGKITGMAHPEQSLEVLEDCGVEDPLFLSLIRHYDTAERWHASAMRAEPPLPASWRRLKRVTDVRLLVLFAVANCADAPAGWRRCEEVVWFVDAARAQGLIDGLVLDA